MGDRRGSYSVMAEKPGGKIHLEDLGADGRILLKCIFKKEDWGRGLDRSGSG
jgi:hypothetical protein